MTAKSSATVMLGEYRIAEDLVPLLRPIDSAKPYPKNPRRGDMEQIKASLKSHGMYSAIQVQKSSGFIIAGEHRWRALKEGGSPVAPFVVMDVDDDEARVMRLRDNRVTDLAEYDRPILLEELTAVGALEDTGWSELDLTDLQAEQDLLSEDVDQKEHKPKFNTEGADDEGDMRIDASRRILVLDVPVEVFPWLIDGLALVMDQTGAESNTDAVIKLVADATGQDVP